MESFVSATSSWADTELGDGAQLSVAVEFFVDEFFCRQVLAFLQGGEMVEDSAIVMGGIVA